MLLIHVLVSVAIPVFAKYSFAYSNEVSHDASTQVLTVRTVQHRVVSCAVHITGARYPRNYLLFNVAFVFDTDADVVPYYSVIRKLASTLRSLEVNSGYIVGDGKRQLPKVLAEVREQLNHNGSVTVVIDAESTLRLQVSVGSEMAPQIQPHEVPLPLCDLSTISVDDLDWAVAEVLPHIDGANYAKAIAECSGVHIAIVLKALQCFVVRGLIAIVPAFQFHSVYLVTRQ